MESREFYRRLDEIVPGAPAPGGVAPFPDAELYFERLSMAGLEEMHRYSTDGRLYEFLELHPFGGIDETRAYIEKLQGRMGVDPMKRAAMYWFVRRKSDGYLVGSAGLVELNYARRSVEWGYGVDPEIWGRGYIMQIQELLKHYVFEVLELNRLSGMTMVENRRVIASVTGAGMKHEGIARQYYQKDGVFHDGWTYGMVREDFVRAASLPLRIAPRHAIEDVIAIVAEILPDGEITAESTMADSVSWDSLSHMLILSAISERLGVSFTPADTIRATSVKAIASIVATRF